MSSQPNADTQQSFTQDSEPQDSEPQDAMHEYDTYERYEHSSRQDYDFQSQFLDEMRSTQSQLLENQQEVFREMRSMIAVNQQQTLDTFRSFLDLAKARLAPNSSPTFQQPRVPPSRLQPPPRVIPTPIAPPAPKPKPVPAPPVTPKVAPSANPDKLVFTFQELDALGGSVTKQVRLDRRLSTLVDREDFLLSDQEDLVSSDTNPPNPPARLPIPTTPDDISTDSVDPHPQLTRPSTAHLPENRRLSVTDRALLGSSALAGQTTTQVVLRPPNHSICLKRLAVRDVLGFFMHILDYQYAHRIPLHAASLIDPPLVRQLLARHPKLNYASFQALDNLKVFQVLQFDSMPMTLFDAYHRLDSAVKFPLPYERYRPSAVDFYPFYTALLAYKREFTMAYDLLTGMLNPSLIPLLSTKEYGLLRIFLNKIPFLYGQRLHAAHLSHRISSPHRNGTASDPNRITTIQQYITVFFKYVDVHYSLYCDARSFGQLFGGSDFHAGNNRDRPRRQDNAKMQRLNALLSPDDLDQPADDVPADTTDDRDHGDPDDPIHPFMDTPVFPIPNLDDQHPDDGNVYDYSELPGESPDYSDPALSFQDIASESLSAVASATHRKFPSDKDRQPPGSRPRSASPTELTTPNREAQRYIHRSTPQHRFPPPREAATPARDKSPSHSRSFSSSSPRA